MPHQQLVNRYPWEKWFTKKGKKDGIFHLKRGREFTCQPHSMAQQVRNAAAARRVKVSIVIDGDQLSVQLH